MSWVVYKHGNRKKIDTITNIFEIFYQYFLWPKFQGPILHTLQAVWRRNGDDDDEEEDDKHN